MNAAPECFWSAFARLGIGAGHGEAGSEQVVGERGEAQGSKDPTLTSEKLTYR